MERVDGEGRAGDRIGATKACGEPLHERCFAHAEVPVERQHDVRWQRRGELAGDGARLGGRGGDDPGAKSSADAHSRETPPV